MNTVPLSMIRLVSPVEAATTAVFVGVGLADASRKQNATHETPMIELGSRAGKFAAPVACVIETLQALNIDPNGVPDYEVSEPVGRRVYEDPSIRHPEMWAAILADFLSLYADGTDCADVVRHVVKLAAMRYHGVQL